MTRSGSVTSFLRRSIAAAVIGILFILSVRIAQAETIQSKASEQTVLHADVVGRGNPAGIMLITGGFRRWDVAVDPEFGVPASYKQAGVMIGVNPANAQVSLYGEWKPAIFAQLRLQYDYYGFFGAYGSLLSFPSSESKYGKSEIDSLSGKEEAVSGHRLLLQPVLTGKIGPVIIRNVTDLAYYRFGGKGPYYYESEYVTLLKDGDFLLNNQTALLLEAWKGQNSGVLLTGPFYEVTHAVNAEITRQRIGIQFYGLPVKTLWVFNQPRVYGQVGMYLQDRNLDNEAFFNAGVGFDF